MSHTRRTVTQSFRRHSILRLIASATSTAAILLSASFVLSGCRAGGTMSAEAANDELRRERVDLQTRIAALEAQNSELRAKVTEMTRAATPALAPEAALALPRVAGIEIGRLSGFEPADPTKPSEAIVVEVSPYDGARRFVPLVGTMRVEVFHVSPVGEKGFESGAPVPRWIGGLELTPEQVREAYRSSLLGTHYEARINLQVAPAQRPGTLIFRVEYKDAVTGASYSAELAKEAR